jgi:hypothetical protein
MRSHKLKYEIVDWWNNNTELHKEWYPSSSKGSAAKSSCEYDLDTKMMSFCLKENG